MPDIQLELNTSNERIKTMEIVAVIKKKKERLPNVHFYPIVYRVR